MEEVSILKSLEKELGELQLGTAEGTVSQNGGSGACKKDAEGQDFWANGGSKFQTVVSDTPALFSHLY